MPVEMIGWIAPRVSSEIIPPSGPPFNPEVIAETARIHEQAGFDRVLIGYFSYAPDGFLIGAHAAAVTSRLQLLLAHRPGFVAPTVAARKLATLDHLSGGRTAVHMMPGAMTLNRHATGILRTTMPAIAAPRSMSRYSNAPGRNPHRLITRGNSTASSVRMPTFAASKCRIYPFTAAVALLPPLRLWLPSWMCTCCGESPSRRPPLLWRKCVLWRVRHNTASPLACPPGPFWGAPKARRGIAPGVFLPPSKRANRGYANPAK